MGSTCDAEKQQRNEPEERQDQINVMVGEHREDKASTYLIYSVY